MNVRLVHQVANQPHTRGNDSISSQMRRRLIELSDLADEADLRAETLQWMTESLPAGDQRAHQVGASREKRRDCAGPLHS